MVGGGDIYVVRGVYVATAAMDMAGVVELGELPCGVDLMGRLLS